MSDYSFDVLNDKDLEHLVRDLLQAELGIYFESFKSGKDEGVDLRHAKAGKKESEIIVQVKHWPTTGLTKLLRHLENEESKKVKTLSPDRYILATSVGLSNKNKRDIASFFHPYIKSRSDIFGRDDLNNLLQLHPDVEKNHYKLWISSTAVLTKIFNNAVISRSTFVQSEIVRKASLFVPTSNFSQAIEILNKTHVLLIEGVPGVGKTTVAEFLVFRLLADDFKLIVIDDDLKEAEENFEPNDRQVFYFDDFLGSNYLQLLQSKGSGADISRFVDRIIRDKSKRMILTTRTTILNRAYEQLHQLGQHKLKRSDFELHLDDYSRYDRARILYNHMYFCGLPSEYSDHIFSNENYLKIIDHENYNPRIIEYITDSLRLESVEPSDYISFIENNLNKPDEIWESAYENQIDSDARFALDTLFSLGESASEEDFRKAFDARLDYEIQHHGYQRNSNAFRKAVRLLLGGFVIHEKSYGTDGSYSFINPSIIDFLISRFAADPADKWRILESSVFYSQLDNRFGTTKANPIRIEKPERGRFLKFLTDKANAIIGDKSHAIKLKMVDLLMKSFQWKEIGPCCKKLLADISFESTTNSTFGLTHRIARSLLMEADGKSILQDRSDELLRGMLQAADDPPEVSQVVALFRNLDLDYDSWLDVENNREFMQKTVDAMWEYRWENVLGDAPDIYEAMYKTEAESAISDLLFEIQQINRDLRLEDSPAFDNVDDIDVDEIVEENRKAAETEDYNAESGGGYSISSEANETALIKELFDR